MKRKPAILLVTGFLCSLVSFGQQSGEQTATYVVNGTFLGERPSLAAQMASGEFIHATDVNKEVNEKRRDAPKAIPGKGFPLNGDPLLSIQNGANKMPAIDPIITWEAASANVTPTDPTGAVGPNHYINSWNSAFRIWNKDGDPLTFSASLATIWAGQDAGDPIVFYDSFADRFVITQFSFSNSFLVAVCTGSDPVNDGWYTYEFDVDVFPDYPKYSVWSDGYYVTANKNSNNAGNTEVVYALEREAMINGEAGAQMVGFPLPGITTSGFYSPLGFNANGTVPPAPGNAPICYMQDDSWGGVSDDHLKIWHVNVNWTNPNSSTISDPQILTTMDFDGLFDGGSFSNIPCPGNSDLDALQATIMYMAQYYRFGSHNSCVLNWVVDLDGDDDYAGIRWMELRQASDGDDWTIYQEGTYAPESGQSAFCGAICIDQFGNIGLSYTSCNASNHPSIRFTGRYSTDPLGEMTVEEGIIAAGVQSPSFFRYGDYAQMTLDPVDGCTFWTIGEHFAGGTRKNTVGAFKLGSLLASDIGVMSINDPISGALTATETITVTLRNYGLDDQTNFDVSFEIDSEGAVTETYPGTLAAGQVADFSFATTGDFSTMGQTYTIWASTDLPGDENTNNDATTTQVTHLEPNDIGVTAITAPVSGNALGSAETITVSLENWGAANQSGFDITYVFDGAAPVTETYAGTLMGQSTGSYSFATTVAFGALGDYDIVAYTSLDGDIDNTNNEASTTVTKELCAPEMDCSFGDGFQVLVLEDINNNSGCDDGGYGDYTNLSTALSQDFVHQMTVTTGYGDQLIKTWIDFNDNFVFENNEVIVNDYLMAEGQAEGATESMDFPVPAGAALGQHLMRAKSNWVDGVPADPCEETQYGETEDYTVEIGASNIENPLGANNLVIATLGEGQFQITLDAPQEAGPLVIKVFNVMGQQIVENKVYSSNGIFQYDLDMSYAAAGSYLVKMGNYEIGKVARIVVR
jgi:hypothetical protein